MLERAEELAAQLRREHREGQAEEIMALERMKLPYQWEVGDWDGDLLEIHVTGFGLWKIPVDQVALLGQILLAEHEFKTRGDAGGTVELEWGVSSVRWQGGEHRNYEGP